MAWEWQIEVVKTQIFSPSEKFISNSSKFRLWVHGSQLGSPLLSFFLNIVLDFWNENLGYT